MEKTPSKQQSSNRERRVERAGGAIVVATNTSKAKKVPERALAGWTVIFSQIHFAGRGYRAHLPAHLECTWKGIDPTTCRTALSCREERYLYGRTFKQGWATLSLSARPPVRDSASVRSRCRMPGYGSRNFRHWCYVGSFDGRVLCMHQQAFSSGQPCAAYADAEGSDSGSACRCAHRETAYRNGNRISGHRGKISRHAGAMARAVAPHPLTPDPVENYCSSNLQSSTASNI